MDGVQRGNAGLAFFGLWSSAPTTVELALLGFAVFEGRTSALLACSTALSRAAKALYFPYTF